MALIRTKIQFELDHEIEQNKICPEIEELLKSAIELDSFQESQVSRILTKKISVFFQTKLPAEILDKIYIHTDFMTALKYNCSEYVLDVLYEKEKKILTLKNLNNFKVFLEVTGTHCYLKDFPEYIKEKAMIYIKNKLNLTRDYFDFNRAGSISDLKEFIVKNRLLIKVFNIKNYAIINELYNKFNEYQRIHVLSVTYNVARMMSGFSYLAYTSNSVAN